MPLESLMELVQDLRERIDVHGDKLRQSEALTRYALIDPLLRELGWDTADPSQVIPEYRVPNNQFADYVLLANGAPKIVVESKKLDEPLRGAKALDQGILYCAHTGSTHFLLTDGSRWEAYESGNTSPKLSFDLKSQPPAEVCLQALALWRPTVEAGRVAAGNPPIIEDQEPLIAKETSTAYLIPPQQETDYSDERAAPTLPIPPKPPSNGGQSLATLNPTPGDAAPNQVTFPDGSTVTVQAWKQVLIEATRWLIGAGILTAGHCPILYSSRSRRCVVHTKPVHLNGKPFSESAREEIELFHVDTHHSASSTMQATRAVIEHVRQDPAQFKVTSG